MALKIVPASPFPACTGEAIGHAVWFQLFLVTRLVQCPICNFAFWVLSKEYPWKWEYSGMQVGRPATSISSERPDGFGVANSIRATQPGRIA